MAQHAGRHFDRIGTPIIPAYGSTMRLPPVLSYLAQAIVLGLAFAFLVTYFWPEIARREVPTVEIRQTVPEAVKRPVNGPSSYAAAVDKASSAVVNINTAKVVTVRPHPFFDDPVFRCLLYTSDAADE